jgi:type IV secretory pathway TrbD component
MVLQGVLTLLVVYLASAVVGIVLWLLAVVLVRVIDPQE